VRKMCEAVGHPVESLARVRVGPITDAKLQPGEFRDLTPAEVRRLKAACARMARPTPAPGKMPG
jgi:23S rRNA pseudouridine2605 synthase